MKAWLILVRFPNPLPSQAGTLPWLIPAIVGGLRSGPLDGEPRPDPSLILVLLDEASQAKVRDLHDVVVADEHVAGSQVPERRKTMSNWSSTY